MQTYILFKLWNDTISTKNSDGQCKLFVQDDIVRLTLDVLGECILGYKFNSIEERNNKIAQAFGEIVTTTDGNFGDKMFRQLLYYLPFTKKIHDVEEAHKITSKAIKQVKIKIITSAWLLRLQSSQWENAPRTLSNAFQCAPLPL